MVREFNSFSSRSSGKPPNQLTIPEQRITEDVEVGQRLASRGSIIATFLFAMEMDEDFLPVK